MKERIVSMLRGLLNSEKFDGNRRKVSLYYSGKLGSSAWHATHPFLIIYTEQPPISFNLIFMVNRQFVWTFSRGFFNISWNLSDFDAVSLLLPTFSPSQFSPFSCKFYYSTNVSELELRALRSISFFIIRIDFKFETFD